MILARPPSWSCREVPLNPEGLYSPLFQGLEWEDHRLWSQPISAPSSLCGPKVTTLSEPWFLHGRGMPGCSVLMIAERMTCKLLAEYLAHSAHALTLCSSPFIHNCCIWGPECLLEVNHYDDNDDGDNSQFLLGAYNALDRFYVLLVDAHLIRITPTLR